MSFIRLGRPKSPKPDEPCLELNALRSRIHCRSAAVIHADLCWGSLGEVVSFFHAKKHAPEQNVALNVAWNRWVQDLLLYQCPWSKRGGHWQCCHCSLDGN